jgi:hypothetical protein
LNESHTNPTPATEATPPSSLRDAQNSENGSPANGGSIPTAASRDLLTSPPNKASELCAWIELNIQAQAQLPAGVSSLIAFWAVSTWFQDALPVFPCLAISGPAHEAMVVLRILRDVCASPVLLAGFRRSDLKTLSHHRTLLISEPNLDKRTAALLGNLTNRGFMIVEGGYVTYRAHSTAIYIGEDPAIGQIQHSIRINIAPTDSGPPHPLQWLQSDIDNLRSRLNIYRKTNLDRVRRLEFRPSGMSSETAAIANALGSCIVNEPDLQQILVALLKTEDRQHLSQKADTAEAVVVEAALALCRQDRQHVYVKEIAVEANRLLEVRGAGLRFSPEKVGHKLRQLGLPTRRLTKAGNGLLVDKATVAGIQKLAVMYVGEDLLSEIEKPTLPASDSK